jgi:hypothetical protein
MLLVRIIALLVVAALAVSLLLYMVTGQRKYLSISWRIFKYALFVVLLILLLFLFERLLVAV